MGQLLNYLKNADILDNTIVIVTADHGDMLGERGLWYKMTFFEHSARVPLIMAGPGVVPGQAANPCSLVDILPTMLDIAASQGAAKPELGDAVGPQDSGTVSLAPDPDVEKLLQIEGGFSGPATGHNQDTETGGAESASGFQLYDPWG